MKTQKEKKNRIRRGPKSKITWGLLVMIVISIGVAITMNQSKISKENSLQNVEENDLNVNDIAVKAANGRETVRFDYNDEVQTFTAPVSTTYTLEIYGASGGGNHEGDHGLGGYAKGEIYLEKNTKLYICPGGAGYRTYYIWDPVKDTEIFHLGGGYNGGGISPYYGDLGSNGTNNSGHGGGGATHIATTNRGTLANYSDHRDEVLLVAGGGGGTDDPGQADIESPVEDGYGGNGGGLTGTPGAQERTPGLGGGRGGTQTSGAAFGQGGSGSNKDGGGGGGRLVWWIWCY